MVALSVAEMAAAKAMLRAAQRVYLKAASTVCLMAVSKDDLEADELVGPMARKMTVLKVVQ